MNKKQNNKVQIISAITSAAKLYKMHLVGKRFLYVFEGRYIEVIYKSQNFRHLTGIATNLSAKQFYQNATNNKLKTNHISFDKQHPFRLCNRKIKHLAQIATLAGAESFMLEEITTNTQTYKFGTHLSKVIVYGSYARGDYRKESDVDVMILVDMSEEEIRKYENCVYDIAFEIEINTGIDISPIIKSESQYKYWVDVLPFYRNVRDEGVVVGE